MVQKRDFLYEGKAKRIYQTDDENLVWIEYKDEATAFDGLKKGVISGKGYYNNQISAILFAWLEEKGIPTHFVELAGEREMIVKRLEIIPVEVVARNVAAGSLSKRLGLEEGTPLQRPVLEFYYKCDELHDPMINEYHIATLELATSEQMDIIKKRAWEINELLTGYFKEKGIILVDFKLEFGIHQGEVLLGDEISPDTCRFWDAESREKLDKDRFRRDLGGVEEAYREILNRLKGGR
ncbi:phosphoribosylaminoimidazolesuccinocarboxamide synthase [Calderihabitans maritimus]|uniref:Phosphoribosylaminoimidazole-succinocarboxamide synthase n=1 Tax=Calderihabitans maritimus TaxID=1246530 RepID=A0A1Z5HS65_9FIRM|nr:phosphoribosylaminoimidazolesuccinocarboxamide synthase [Calderihabitans maritimus]GAW92171.1 phosphoribosylaminoimidazole-succinocarboxamide synthase [Calderihabitans maritimus]